MHFITAGGQIININVTGFVGAEQPTRIADYYNKA